MEVDTSREQAARNLLNAKCFADPVINNALRVIAGCDA